MAFCPRGAGLLALSWEEPDVYDTAPGTSGYRGWAPGAAALWEGHL